MLKLLYKCLYLNKQNNEKHPKTKKYNNKKLKTQKIKETPPYFKNTRKIQHIL